MLAREGRGPVLDDGGHQLAYPCIPVLKVLHKHVSHVGGVNPCDGVMVLDLGAPRAGRSRSGPAPAQHLLSWRPLGTGSPSFSAGANGKVRFLPLYRRGNRSDRLMDLPAFVYLDLNL